MNLDNARNLKTNMIALARDRLVDRLRTRGATRGGFAEAAPPTRSGTGVAFGIAPTTRSGQYKLAVRVMSRDQPFVREVMAGMPSMSDDDMDVVAGVKYEPRWTARAGGSCGHVDITAGTLGAFVEDDDHYYALSNNHVIANSDLGRVGDEVWYPGPDDVRRNKYEVLGYLHRWPRLRETSTRNVDAALARLADEVSDFYPWDYAGIGTIRKTPISDRFAVTNVVKRGRTTNVTRGHVSAFDLDGVQLDYGTRRNPRTITFDNQLEFTHRRPQRWDFSAGGDSGSLIIDEDTMRPYALLYGGGPDDDGIDRTLGHFIVDVLDKLRVRFVR